MIGSIDSPNSMVNITAVAQRLVRTIMFSKGQFSLLLARCNSTTRQKQVLSLIREFSPVEIVELSLPNNAETLYNSIASGLDSTLPQGLMVTGLESVRDINQLMISANFMRDEFPKHYNFPIVLWVNDEILRKLIRLAPDFKNWSTTLRFDSLQESLMEPQVLSA
ncbi:hypothetical protein [Mastigocoleus testarum]|uniref:WD repeat-containing protein n=1 Tax=Mastigocoleus testarum BC008 TaxID=371196 RepID=A0A0V7ZLG2_9CYAN|nr:hypothetical protein [Mastigocoleus testarum]KST65477.1 hypothetical protein BC008_41855 [Mastigocoleus testarum BC008]